MTLALVIPGPLDRRSGGYSYDVDMVAYLESLGHRVSVWSLPEAPGKARKTLVQRLTEGAPEAVIFDALVHRPLVSVLERLRQRSGSFWIALVHHLAWLDDPVPGPGTPGKRDRERRFLETMDAYLFNSADTRQTVADLRGPGAPFRPSLVCRPPLPPPPPVPQVPGNGRFLFLGNQVPRKNLHGLLAALVLLNRRNPRLVWNLTVAGSGELDRRYAARCRRVAQHGGIAGRIRWAGRVSDEEKEVLWSQTDLLTLPSFHEGWGMAHAEGLARGIPALAVRQGGVAEVLGDAALWTASDPEALAPALESFLTRPGLRADLALRARHRRQVLTGRTGFPELPSFLASLAALRRPNSRSAPDFDAYLESKASVDSRSLHPRVLASALSGPAPRTVLELGGGTGTMARRLREGGWIGPDTSYELIDRGGSGLETAREKAAGLFQPGKFSTREADLLTVWEESRPGPPDLVIAHALLDLFDPRAAAPALARLGARRYWLTHLFDGLTSWEPQIDPDLDNSLIRAYHRSMDERASGGAQGSSRSARDWLTALPSSGFRILDAGSSDWIVRSQDGVYPDDEAEFLRAILHFFQASLKNRSEVDQAGLAWWLAVRQAQVDRGEAVFLAHQLDLTAELVHPAG